MECFAGEYLALERFAGEYLTVEVFGSRTSQLQRSMFTMGCDYALAQLAQGVSMRCP